MTNIEKYIQAYVNAFDVNEEEVPALKYQEIPAWPCLLG